MVQLNVGGNFLAGLSGGLQAGQAIRGIQDQNALREIGPGLVSGDQNALAQFAQIDPMGAMQLERQRAEDVRAERQFTQTSQLNTARLEQIKAESARAVADEARRLTAEQRAAEAAKIDGALAAASAAYQQGPQAFEAWKTQNARAIQESKLDPAQITYDSFPMVAASLVGTREGLTAGAEFAQGLRPEEVTPMSPEGKLMADLQAGRITQEQFNAANPGGVKVGARAGHFLGSSGGFHTATAPESGVLSAELQRLEDKMLMLGARLTQRGGQAETAEAARINASAEASTLDQIVNNLSEGIEAALEDVALFVGAAPGTVQYRLNTDFWESSLDAATLGAIVNAGQTGVIAKIDQLHMIRRGKIEIAEGRTDEQIQSDVAANYIPDDDIDI
jgi:hypothetical protein